MDENQRHNDGGMIMMVTVRTIVGALVPMSVAVGAAGFLIPPPKVRADKDHDVRTTLIAGAAVLSALSLLILLGTHLR